MTEFQLIEYCDIGLRQTWMTKVKMKMKRKRKRKRMRKRKRK